MDQNSPQCEGSLTSWAHTDLIKRYQLYDKDGEPDCKAFLCSNCVKYDIWSGYDWREMYTGKGKFKIEGCVTGRTSCKLSQEPNT